MRMHYCLRLGLGDGREIYILQPERQPNKVTEDEIKNKKPNKEISARTKDDRSAKDDEMHVSPAFAKSPCNLKTVEAV